MNENTKKCPICPRNCDLSAPHCGRGAEYARTGNLPREEKQEHRHPRRLQFETREQQLIMKYLHHATGAADHGGLTQEDTKEMFAVLTKEETAQLAALLEKLSDHWMALAPNKPHHHHPAAD